MSVVALDIGTSRTKAILASWDGTIREIASTATPSVSAAPGQLEFPGDAVHATAAALVAALAARHRTDPVDTLVVTCLGTAMVPLDRAGRPLAPALSPADARPGAVPGLLDEVDLSPERFFDLTGQDPRLTSFLHHWLWWRREQPRMLDAVARFRSLRGLVVDRLAGADAEDASWASRTMVMDLAADAWSTEILDAAGLSLGVLPAILPSTATFPVRPAAAAGFGLAPGAQVVLGAMDNCSSFLGATDPSEARLVNIAGTFEHMAGVGDLPETRAAAIAVGGLIHRYLLPGRFLSYSRVPVGILLARVGEASPDGLEPLLAAISTSPGATDPWAGVPDEPAVRACLAAGDDPAAVLQDVLESCAALLVRYADAWTGAGAAAERVVAVGGGAHGPVLRLKANLLCRPVSTLASDEGAGFGALRLAAIARHGMTLTEACAHFPNPVATTWTPDTAAAP